MRKIPLGRKTSVGSLNYPIRARVEWRKDPLRLEMDIMGNTEIELGEICDLLLFRRIRVGL